MNRLRSLLFVPGDRPERFDKAADAGADAIVLDLEDAVLPEAKPAARQAVAAWLAASGRAAIVRVNSAGTPWFDDDLRAARGSRCRAVVLPKSEDPAVLERALPEPATAAQVGEAEPQRDSTGRRPEPVGSRTA